MVKVTPYVSPCRKEEEPSTKKLHLRITKPATDTMDDVAEAISHSTTVTKTDIAAVLSGLREHIVSALSEGRSIHLENLGRISLIPYFTRPVHENEKFRNKDISTKGVQFLPDREFIKEVRHKTQYQAEALYKPKDITLEEVMAFCSEWFAEHEVMLCSDLMHGLSLKRGKADRLLTALVEKSELVRQKYGNIVQYKLSKK